VTVKVTRCISFAAALLVERFPVAHRYRGIRMIMMLMMTSGISRWFVTHCSLLCVTHRHRQ